MTRRLVCRDSRTELLVRSVESRGLGGGQCVGWQETQKVVRAEVQEGQERGWVGKWAGAVGRGCGQIWDGREQGWILVHRGIPATGWTRDDMEARGWRRP